MIEILIKNCDLFKLFFFLFKIVYFFEMRITKNKFMYETIENEF